MAHADHSGHSHEHHCGASRRALFIVLGLLALHMAVEIAGRIISGSIISGSLGLLAHATHMLTDLVAICLAIFAMWVAERPATITRTFGFQRIEAPVVMLNALALWALASWIVYEAYQRFNAHAHGHHHLVDPIVSMVIAALILVSSMRLGIRVFRVLPETVPPHLDMYELRSALEDEEGVTPVHDVHAWTITPGYEAFTAHVPVDADNPSDRIDGFLRRLREIIRHDYGIRHITLQVETSVEGCGEENHHVDHLAARSFAEA